MTKKIIIIFLMIMACFSIGIKRVDAETLETNVVYSLAGSGDKCNAIFGDPKDDSSVAHYLNSIFEVLKWLAPLLCLVFSVIEFVKAAASQDKEALNKATSKTIKRICLALVMFFIPSLINFLFPLLGWYGTCGIGGE